MSLLSHNTGVPQNSEAQIRSRVLADRSGHPKHPKTPPHPQRSHKPTHFLQVSWESIAMLLRDHQPHIPTSPWDGHRQECASPLGPALPNPGTKPSCCRAGVTKGKPRSLCCAHYDFSALPAQLLRAGSSSVLLPARMLAFPGVHQHLCSAREHLQCTQP